MELYVYLIMAYMGVTALGIMLSALALMLFSYAVYKCDKGKLSLWQFAKRWKI